MSGNTRSAVRRIGARTACSDADASRYPLLELEPSIADGVPEPLDADLWLGRALARRLLDSRPGLEKALREGCTTLVVETQTADLVQPLGEGLILEVFGEPADDEEADKIAARWTTFWRDGTQRTHKPDDGNAAVRRALLRGRSVVAISHAPERHLPSDVLRIADHRLQAPPIDAAVIAEVAHALTGKRPRTKLDDVLARLVTVGDVMLAVRPDSAPDSYIARVGALAEARRAKPDLTLDRLHGMPEVVAWGTALARDLTDYTAGRIRWSDVDRGILLVGPPGVGKTTAARALAGTCGVPLVVGSFAQWQARGHLGDMLKGMNQTFEEARSRAPCILFIDEIEAVGDRARFTGHNANYETQVMNATLEQLDGIAAREGVVVVAATNYADRLDPALRRPGRLDREVRIDLPDAEALAGILRFHLGDELAGADLSRAAAMLVGASGAEVEQRVRDARRGARHSRRPMAMDDLLAAIRGGRPTLSADDRRRSAVHEAGHALIGTLERPGLVISVSTLPTDASGGAVSASWDGSRLMTPSSLQARLRFVLGGRAAEEVALGVASTGAGGGADSDLARATSMAVTALSAHGMREGDQRLVWHGMHAADRVPAVLAANPPLARDAAALLETAYGQALDMLRRHRAALDEIVEALLARDVLNGEEVEAIVAQCRTTESPDRNGATYEVGGVECPTLAH